MNDEMTKGKMTLGPWTVEENVKAGGIVHLAITARHAGNDWMPCSITPMWMVRDVDRANAKAIAALPDCITALQAAEEVLRNLGRFEETLDVVQAALKKAGVV